PAEPCEAPAGLAEALGVVPLQACRNRMDYLAEVASEEVVRGLQPDFTRLAALPVRGGIVTAAASGAYDFVSRFFAPASGVAEDPVTGSAQCCLATFWGARLGKMEMRAYQASARGGEVLVRREGGRVRLGGQAVTVLRGELCV